MSYFKRNIAIIIGINNYQSGIPTLKTATNDAQKIARVLERQHGYKIWGLIDEQATLTGCLQMLEKFLPQQIKERDRLIFYFAGHGIALNGEDGPEGFLIPQDARLGDTSTYLPMTRLQKALDKLSCRHFLTILDCCFAGAFRWSSTRKLLVVPDIIHRQHYDRFLESAAWQVITSASHNQTASDSLALSDQSDRGITDRNHSPFAAALIEALQGAADSSPPARDGKPPGDGVITASELYLYLRDRVEVATERKGILQTPGLYPLRKHDRGEYIFHSPGREINLSAAPPLDESQNPYRGLESFDSRHSQLFFGREALTQKLYQFCYKNPLTVVLGASGTGKSSLVKAGLVSYINQLRAVAKKSWQILPTMRPGESAFKSLNQILTVYQSSGSSILSHNSLEKKNILSGKVEYILTKNPRSKLLLVIDQAEELITLAQNSSERNDFLNLLQGWLTKYPQQLRVVLTLRSDFEPQFHNLALKSFWQKARFIVPAMTREELREAIEKPAAARVMYFEPYSLVDCLIDEVAQMPGALPLLSFALSELYLKYLQKFRAGNRDKRAIVQEDYQEIGGVAQSLTQRADSEYNELVEEDPAYAETIRYVMLRAIAVGGGELARRRVPLSELRYPAPEDLRVKEVINRFTAARLLVEGQDAEMNPYVEPAHDALVRGWQKLLKWKREEEDSLLLQRRLTPAAQEWKNLEYKQKRSSWRSKSESLVNWLDARLYSVENLFYVTRDGFLKLIRNISDEQNLWRGKPEQYLWNTNPYLNVLKEKLDTNNLLFNQIEAEFLQISIRRKRNNRRRLIASVTIVMLSLSTLTVVAFWKEQQAQDSRRDAENAKQQAQIEKQKALEAQQKLTTVSKQLRDNLNREKELIELIAAANSRPSKEEAIIPVISEIDEDEVLEEYEDEVLEEYEDEVLEEYEDEVLEEYEDEVLEEYEDEVLEEYELDSVDEDDQLQAELDKIRQENDAIQKELGEALAQSDRILTKFSDKDVDSKNVDGNENIESTDITEDNTPEIEDNPSEIIEEEEAETSTGELINR